MAGEVVHDLDFAADVFDVIAVDEFAGSDGFAGEVLLGFLVSYQIGDAELAPAQLAPEYVSVTDVLHGTAEDAADGGSGRGGGVAGTLLWSWWW